ncbi:MAG: Sensor Protein [Acidobacteria bacterium]|nr:Sensor Protein [Acidobacteriota bacterium]
MKDFSLFQQALEIADSSRFELGTIAGISRRDFDRKESFVFRTQTPCLEYACLMIENTLLMRTNRSGRIYAGFEKLSCLQPIIDRYLRIADVSESVYLFGEDDWQPPRHPNIRLVKLRPDQPLAREWFVIADSSNYQAALIALDEDGFEVGKPDERNFTVFKSSTPSVVTKLAHAAEAMIDRSFAL